MIGSYKRYDGCLLLPFSVSFCSCSFSSLFFFSSLHSPFLIAAIANPTRCFRRLSSPSPSSSFPSPKPPKLSLASTSSLATATAHQRPILLPNSPTWATAKYSHPALGFVRTTSTAPLPSMASRQTMSSFPRSPPRLLSIMSSGLPPKASCKACILPLALPSDPNL